MKKKILAMIVAALGAVSLLTACSGEKVEELPVVDQTQLPDKVENDVQQQEQIEVQPDDVIVTTYGTLKYPGMWTDRVEHEVIEDGTDVEVRFYSTVEEEKVVLFILYYGNAPETAYQCSEVQIEDMIIPISVVTPTVEPKDSWPEGVYDELRSLQESQNDILMQLTAEPEEP